MNGACTEIDKRERERERKIDREIEREVRESDILIEREYSRYR